LPAPWRQHARNTHQQHHCEWNTSISGPLRGRLTSCTYQRAKGYFSGINTSECVLAELHTCNCSMDMVVRHPVSALTTLHGHWCCFDQLSIIQGIVLRALYFETNYVHAGFKSTLTGTPVAAVQRRQMSSDASSTRSRPAVTARANGNVTKQAQRAADKTKRVMRHAP
jgi:hypothetical protein